MRVTGKSKKRVSLSMPFHIIFTNIYVDRIPLCMSICWICCDQTLNLHCSLLVLTNADIFVQDPKLLAALQESRKRQAPYCGAFLLKDEPDTDPSVVTGSESEKNIGDLKGKDLYNRLHEVGTLAQVLSFVPNFFFPFCHKELLLQNKTTIRKFYMCLCHLIFNILFQITTIQGDQVILIGHRRLRITEMVSVDELVILFLLGLSKSIMLFYSINMSS